LRGIKFLDDRVANPSYAGLLIVGILLVLLGPWEFTQFWIYAAIALNLVMGNAPGGVGATATGPMVLWTNSVEGGEVFRRSAGE
jgi:hypothetical protein